MLIIYHIFIFYINDKKYLLFIIKDTLYNIYIYESNLIIIKKLNQILNLDLCFKLKAQVQFDEDKAKTLSFKNIDPV